MSAVTTKPGTGNTAPGTMLAIEISTSQGQIAVVRGDDVIFSTVFASQRSHNAQMFAPLGEALKAAGDSLDLIVVGTGPGSYTGVRIAIAAAQGVGLSRSVPVIGLPSILAAADAIDLPSFCIVGDARRDSYFVAHIANRELTGEIQLIAYAEIDAWLDAQGNSPIFTFESRVAENPRMRLTAPSALALAKLASRLSLDDISRRAALPLEPVYLREAFITTPKRPWLQV